MNNSQFNVYFYVGYQCAVRVQSNENRKSIFEFECERDELGPKLRATLPTFVGENLLSEEGSSITFNLLFIKGCHPEFVSHLSGILQGIFDCEVRF